MSISSAAFRFIPGLASLLAIGTVIAAEPVASEPEPSPDTPVAVVGKDAVPYSELLGAAGQQLGQEQAEYVAHQQQLEVEYQRARHATLDAELSKLVNKRVLDLEAQKKKTSPEKLLANLGTPTVTGAEVQQFYAEHKAQTQESFEKLEGRIRDHLVKEKSKAATEKYYAGLRAKYRAEIQLEPLRARVGSQGPSRGPDTAPVTIIEFADFQCPYCRTMEPVLKEVLKRYPDTVRLVYRNFPLVSIHPQAMQAAQAAMCADKQGKFWEMHDALFSPGADLEVSGLRATAHRVGLDSEQFEQCVRSQESNSIIQGDSLAATELAINGTPALFVNGRFIGGAVSLQTLSALIDDELQRKKSSVGAARLTSAR